MPKPPEAAEALGQEISTRLFTAGLDLHYVLMTVRNGLGQRHLEHAIDEIDEAIRDLRHLMLAVLDESGELA